MTGEPSVNITIEILNSRVEAWINGVVIASSETALLLRETGCAPVVYFPRDDVDTLKLGASHHETFCPHKGTASHFSISVETASRQNAAWSYKEPLPQVERIRDHIAFYPRKIDRLTGLTGS